MCLAALLIFTSPASSQNVEISPVVQKMMDSLATQRNTALNAQAIAESNLAIANEDLKKAQDRIKELEKKTDPDKKLPTK